MFLPKQQTLAVEDLGLCMLPQSSKLWQPAAEPAVTLDFQASFSIFVLHGKAPLADVDSLRPYFGGR